MRGAALVAVLAVVACGGPTTATPHPSTSPQAVATVATASPSPVTTTPRVGPVSAFSARCRLPVAWTAVVEAKPSLKAGFVHFPGATVDEDKAANLPAGAGSYLYDRAFSRWLPVSREAVTPDGARYASTEGSTFLGTQGHLHVIDVATKRDRVIYSGVVYRVVDFAPEGIYLTEDRAEYPNTGLWLESPDGGTPHLINRSILQPSIGGGAAWGEDFNRADMHPAPGGLTGPRNQIERLDLTTGRTTPWFWRAGSYVNVAGFDAHGRPIVLVNTPAPNDPDVNAGRIELWLVTSSTAAARLLSGPYSKPWPMREAAVDANGIWFDAYDDSIWLYSQGAMRMIAATNMGQLRVAGGCIPD